MGLLLKKKKNKTRFILTVNGTAGLGSVGIKDFIEAFDSAIKNNQIPSNICFIAVLSLEARTVISKYNLIKIELIFDQEETALRSET